MYGSVSVQMLHGGKHPCPLVEHHCREENMVFVNTHLKNFYIHYGGDPSCLLLLQAEALVVFAPSAKLLALLHDTVNS